MSFLGLAFLLVLGVIVWCAVAAAAAQVLGPIGLILVGIATVCGIVSGMHAKNGS